jgi:hypothetical protein
MGFIAGHDGAGPQRPLLGKQGSERAVGGAKKSVHAASLSADDQKGRCCADSTERAEGVARVQRNSIREAKYFAKERLLWCNNYNFPKGGWPGDPAGARKCLHFNDPFAPEPYV